MKPFRFHLSDLVRHSLHKMTKGTASKGPKHNKTHVLCIRCGKRSYMFQKKRCASCGYPGKKMRRYNWSIKSKRRRTQGTGRMRYMKHIARRAKNGFREGTAASSKKSNAQID